MRSEMRGEMMEKPRASSSGLSAAIARVGTGGWIEQRSPAGIAQHEVLADYVGGLQVLGIGEIGGDIGLQNDFMSAGRGKEVPLHAVQRIVRRRRKRAGW